MINATIMISPVETNIDHGVSAGSSKGGSEKSEFDSILGSKMNEEKDQVGNDKQEAKVEDKPTERPDAASKSSAEDKEVKAEDAKVEEQPASDDLAAKADESPEVTSASDQNAAVQNVAVQDAAVVEAITAQVANQIDQQANVLAGTDVSKTVQQAAQVQVVGQVDQPDFDVEVKIVNVDQDVKQVASKPVELPITDEKAAGTSKNTEQKAVEFKSSFFGFNPAKPDAEITPQKQENIKAVQASLTNASIIDASAKSQVQNTLRTEALEGKSVRTKLAETFGVSPEAVQVVEAKPAPQPVKDVTFSPQVIKVLTQESAQLAIPVQAAASSEKPDSENPGDGAARQAAQNIAAVANDRTPLDSAVKGLEAASKPQQTEAPRTDLHARIIDQLAREVKLHQVQGQSDITVKLNPAELGAIKLQVTQTEAGLTSHIQTSSEQVKGLLQAHMPALVDALSDAGLKLDQVTVTAETTFGSLLQDNASANQQQNKQKRNLNGGNNEVEVDPAVINAVNSRLTLGGSVGYSWLA